jgi:hypothetical protein
MAGPRTVDMSAAENPGEHGQDGWLTCAGDEGGGSVLPPSARAPGPQLSRGAGENSYGLPCRRRHLLTRLLAIEMLGDNQPRGFLVQVSSSGHAVESSISPGAG